MNLIDIIIDSEQLLNNRIGLADTFRMAILQEDEELFSLLEYENDSIFLDPSVFCYFLSDIGKENKNSLKQILFGYIKKEYRSSGLQLKSDIFGLIDFPNFGYIKTEPLYNSYFLNEYIENAVVPKQKLGITDIVLNIHPTNHLCFQSGVKFNEPTERTLNNNYLLLLEASQFFEETMHDFWQLIQLVTREIVVFSSPNYNSFAGIMQLGTAYLNIEGKEKSLIFFIDDIAHQCGHILFYFLTTNTTLYLKVHKDHPLKDFSLNPYEIRTVYDAFHGMFTLVTILYSLQTVIHDTRLNKDGLQVFEALARIGFYLSKFRLDLQLMNNSKIFTPRGFQYFNQFESSYNQLFSEFGSLVKGFSYINQPYTFDFEVFLKFNPLPQNKK